MRKNTILETITAITFLVFVGVILYYSFYPFKVTTLNSIGINKAEYCRGEWVEIEMDFQKHMDVEAKVLWYIVDGIVYELDSPGINRPQGDNHIVVSKQVPHSILPGRYNMRVVQTYEVHPLHKPIVNTWNTPIFDVLPASECPDNPDENLSFPDPVNRPVIQQPAPQINSIEPSTQNSGVSAQPAFQSTTVITEQKPSEPQVTTSKPETPVKDLVQSILKPVKGLLQ